MAKREIKLKQIIISKQIEKNHLEYATNKILPKVEKYKQDLDVDTYNFLKNNFEKIITGKPQMLLDLEKKLYNTKKSDVIKTLKGTLKNIFNYKSFSSNRKTEDWNAYNLIRSLNIMVCPYCNMNYAITYNDKDKKLRADLDHFFPQVNHPLLALSLYNLVPSCNICNSRLKGAVENDIHNTFHPYINDINKSLYFSREFNSESKGVDFYQSIMGDNQDYTISTRAYKLSEQNIINQYNDAFHLEKRYSFTKNLINLEIKKYILYNPLYLKSLDNTYGKHISYKNIQSIYFKEDINNNLLSKLMNDIFINELKIK